MDNGAPPPRVFNPADYAKIGEFLMDLQSLDEFNAQWLVPYNNFVMSVGTRGLRTRPLTTNRIISIMHTELDYLVYRGDTYVRSTLTGRYEPAVRPQPDGPLQIEAGEWTFPDPDSDVPVWEPWGDVNYHGDTFRYNRETQEYDFVIPENEISRLSDFGPHMYNFLVQYAANNGVDIPNFLGAIDHFCQPMTLYLERWWLNRSMTVELVRRHDQGLGLRDPFTEYDQRP